MQLNRRIIGFFALAALAIFAGCATSTQPDQLDKYGLIQPARKWMISKIDKEKFSSPVGAPRNVLPGKHTIVQSACPTPNSCTHAVMTFEVRAGLKYDLENMRVLDRFTNDEIGMLFRTTGNEYVLKETAK